MIDSIIGINEPVFDHKFTSWTSNHLDPSCNISSARVCSGFNGDYPWPFHISNDSQ